MLIETAIIPRLHALNSLWPDHHPLRCWLVTVVTLRTPQEGLFKEQAATNSKVDESLVRGGRKLKFTSPPPLPCDKVGGSEQLQVISVKTRPLAGCKPTKSLTAFQSWQRPVGCTAPVQIKHTPGCHVSGRIQHHRTKYVGSAVGMHNNCIHDPASQRFVNLCHSSSRSAHTQDCESLDSPPDPSCEIAQGEYFG